MVALNLNAYMRGLDYDTRYNSKLNDAEKATPLLNQWAVESDNEEQS
jgi:hypothetical protein